MSTTIKAKLKTCTKNYLSSFKLKKEDFLKSILLDFAVVAIVFLLFFALDTFLMSKLVTLIGIQGGAANLDQLLSGLSEAEAALYIKNLQVLVLGILFGLLVAGVASISAFAYTRKKIWDNILRLKKEEKSSFWRWLLFTLVFFVFAFLLLVVASLITLIIGQIFTKMFYDPTISQFISRIIGTFLLSAIFLVLFALNYSFAKLKKVWASIGETFALIKDHRRSLTVILFNQFLTLIIVTTIVSYVSLWILPMSSIPIIQFIVFLLYITWARLYFVKTIKIKKVEN